MSYLSYKLTGSRQRETPHTAAAKSPITIIGSGYVLRYNSGVGGC